RRLARRHHDRLASSRAGVALFGLTKVFVEHQDGRRDLLVELHCRPHVFEAVVSNLTMPTGAIEGLDRAAIHALALRRCDAERLAREIQIELRLTRVRRAVEVQRLT